MEKVAFVLLFCGLSAFSQQQAQVWAIPATPDGGVTGELLAGLTAAKPHAALVGVTDQVFPHIAVGGGWSTIITIVNISTQTVSFTNRFYADDGSPLTVSFFNYPQSDLTTTSAAAGLLPPGSSFNFALFSNDPLTKSGWASMEYTGGRIGGYAIFRQSITGRATFEALTPVSAYDDYKFYMSFDNIQGFVTAIALVNPASNLTSHVTISARDLDGNPVGSTTITLPPHGHAAFVLSDLLPFLANRLGTLYVQSDINRLSAIGIRLNGLGGFAFTSVPIMNWVGMFP